jgi:hypothetical protein
MDRRQFLVSTSATVAAASVGGCLGNVLGGGKEIFKNVATKGTSLIVTFPENSNIQSVNLIASDGTQFNGTRLSSGEYKAAIGLLSTSISGVDYAYTPGTYTLVAVDSENTEHNREITLRPQTSITDVSFLRNHWGGTYEKIRRYTAPMVTIDNTASDSTDTIVGPDIVVDSGVKGPNVPQPRPLSAKTGGGSGVVPVGKVGGSKVFVIDADTTRRALTRYEPFAFPADDGYDSKTAVRQQWAGATTDATAVLKTLTGTTTDFTVKYAGNVQQIYSLSATWYFANSKVVSTAPETTPTTR